jgi:hypothetical protein
MQSNLLHVRSRSFLLRWSWQEVARPLRLDERMMALAAAISIDYDYFSQHSHGPGMMPGARLHACMPDAIVQPVS